MNLYFDYTLLPHPYPDEPLSKQEKWCSFALKILDDNGNEIRTLIQSQWDLLPILNWFVDNKDSLLSESLPISINDESSIAKGIYQFYDTLDDSMTLEKIVDDMFEYRERHEITFALRGKTVDDIIIGLKDDKYTVSLYNEEEKWSYEIRELENFILGMERILLDSSH